MWLETFIPMYAVGIPVGLLMMKKAPCEHKEAIQLGGKNFFLFLLMCFPLMYGGNIIGTLLSTLLSGGTATNGLFQYAFDNNPLKIIVVVILAPLLEEFLFRKQVIDRCVKYGEKTAILFSALAFGLFHMNLYQFFYAAAVGVVFGYIYIRTGKLRYTVALHMAVNLVGSVYTTAMLRKLDLPLLETDPALGLLRSFGGVAMMASYYLFMLAVLVSLPFAVWHLRRMVRFRRGERTLTTREWARVLLLNPAVWCFLAVCGFFFAMALLA